MTRTTTNDQRLRQMARQRALRLLAIRNAALFEQLYTEELAAVGIRRKRGQ